MDTLLTQAELKTLLHYDPDTGVFTNAQDRNPRARKNAVAGHVNSLGYIALQINKRKMYAHRLAWLYMTGYWPDHEIDHINRIRSDNRFCNLRQATSTENKHNTNHRRNNSSGVRGVVWHAARKKWQAQIAANGKSQYLGLYDSFDDAVKARQQAAAKLHSFAKDLS